MPVELKIIGENTTELLIHISELGDIARAILGGVSTPSTPTDTLQRMQQELEQEFKEVLAENAEVAAAANGAEPSKPAKSKGGRPRKAAAPVEAKEEDEDPLDLLGEEEEKVSPPPAEDPKEVLARAVNLLSIVYRTEGGIPAVKEVLDKYGVKKFGHFDPERASEIMADATAIQKRLGVPA
jgi:hypothetical protein